MNGRSKPLRVLSARVAFRAGRIDGEASVFWLPGQGWRCDVCPQSVRCRHVVAALATVRS